MPTEAWMLTASSSAKLFAQSIVQALRLHPCRATVAYLSLFYRIHQFVEPSLIDIADCNQVEVLSREGVHMKAGALRKNTIGQDFVIPTLADKDRSAVFADAIEEQSSWAAVQVGQVGSLELRVARQILWEIEA